jgi:hypothetical protein
MFDHYLLTLVVGLTLVAAVLAPDVARRTDTERVDTVARG